MMYQGVSNCELQASKTKEIRHNVNLVGLNLVSSNLSTTKLDIFLLIKLI